MLVAMTLCVAILALFEFLNPRQPPTEDEAAQVAAEGKAEPKEDEAETPAAPKPGDEPEAPAADETKDRPPVEVVEEELRNDLLALRITNRSPGRGGIIAGTQLLDEQFEGHDTATNTFLLGKRETLAVSFADEATDFRVPPNATYELRSASQTQATLGYTDDEVEVVQELELLQGYEARLRVRVTNRTNREQQHRLHVRTRIGVGEDSRYDIHRGVCRLAEDFEYEDRGDVEDGPILYTGEVLWGGVDSKYFGTYVVPENPLAACEVSVSEDQQFVVSDLGGHVVRVEPGKTKEYLFGLYIGAKEIDRLEKFSAVDLPEGDLEEAVDWGFLGIISEGLGRMLLAMLRWFHSLTGIWGVAIILLTVVVKLVTLPLTLKQMSSMKRMKEIQPEIEKIKKKYGEDRVKQGQEMQALFARSGVNPLAGCLPMVVQLPIWFALYSMLNTAAELLHESFLWLPDLTKQDPYYILPLALGAMMILQNRMMPTAGGDPTQQKLMRWVMPVMFTGFMLFLPSGLGVYIFVNIVLSVIQTAIQVGTKSSSGAETKAG